MKFGNPKRKAVLCTLLFLFFLGWPGFLFAQITAPQPSVPSSPPAAPVTAPGQNPQPTVLNPPVAWPGSGVPAKPLGGAQTPGAPAMIGASSSIFIPGGINASISNLIPYDPLMDNHFKAPAKPIGLFGKPIKEVEQILKTYGAKPYSYAFGKHSRMAFSVYLVTLIFTRTRVLGGLEIDPRPPFDIIESEARTFFLNLFLNQQGTRDFSIDIASNALKIYYRGPSTKGKN